MMKRALQLVVLMAVVVAPMRASAQSKVFGDGTTWSVKADHLTVGLVATGHINKGGGPELTIGYAGLYFSLEPGWHVYWVNAGDAGLPPSIEWQLPPKVDVSPLQFPVPKRLPNGPLMDYGYEGTVVYPMQYEYSRKQGVPVHARATVQWLVCREVCIPGKALLGTNFSRDERSPELDSSVTALQTLWNTTAEFMGMQLLGLPNGATASVQSSKTEFVLTLLSLQGHIEIYPFDQGQIVNAAPQRVEPIAGGVRIHLQKDDTLMQDPASLHLLVKVSDTVGYEVKVPLSIVAAKSSAGDVTLLAAIGLAFLGGIILNLMPCVFPVLFLKGLALVQGSGEERSRLRKHGLVYTLGILVSFWVIVGVLLALRASGARLGWGFQLQSPAFIAVLCIGIFFFALSLAGMFELGLTLTSAGGELAQKQGYTGSFFTGVLATVVATPCTAPLMGAAVGFALAQSAWMAFVVFTAVALGLALPYLLLSFNPAWTRLLPKPGAWMEILKQLTAVPLFATVIWLAWVFGTLRGLDQMARLMIALLFAAIAAWVMGRWPGKTFAAVAAAVLLLCGLAVPLAHKEATSLTWQEYSPQALADARASGKAVFVDFTAAWCLSCHVNEEFVLDSADVEKRFSASGIVLMRADWTKYDPAITAELASVGRSGVPTYVIFPANNAAPDVLPELLSKGVVLDALARDLK